MAENSGGSSKKPRGRGRPFEKGESGNPGGRPKNAVSITAQLRELLAKSPVEVADKFESHAKRIRAGGETPYAALIAGQVLDDLSKKHVDARLFREVLDRTEGKVPQVIKTWVDEIVELIKQGAVKPDEVEAELGRELAVELFRKAGVEIS